MTILVIAEHDHNKIKPATLNTVGAAQKIGGDVHVLVIGKNCSGAADAAAKIAGVSKVLKADAAEFEQVIGEHGRADFSRCQGYEYIVHRPQAIL